MRSHDNRLIAPSHRYNYVDSDRDRLPQHRKISYLDDAELDHDDIEMIPVELSASANLRRLSSNQDDELDRDRPSNERLLLTAFFSFMGFTILQSIAAFAAGSEAMIGDSAAMAVDSLTYLFNLVAERRKSRFEEFWTGTEETDPNRRKRMKDRAKRKMVLWLEIIPPVISVVTLVAVTAVVLRSSLGLLMLDAHRDRTEQGDPNVNLMLGFSLVNLLLDFMNVCCFARANRSCGFKTSHEHTRLHENVVTDGVAISTMPRPRKYAAVGMGDIFEHRDTDRDDDDIEDHFVNGTAQQAAAARNGHHVLQGQVVAQPPISKNEDFQKGHVEEEEEANLNMCSAYTHVFADTLRSFAVVIASVLAELVDGITSEEADASAAVAVSILIILSLLPLLHGLCLSCSELRGIYAEERDEKLYPAGATKVSTNVIT